MSSPKTLAFTTAQTHTRTSASTLAFVVDEQKVRDLIYRKVKRDFEVLFNFFYLFIIFV